MKYILTFFIILSITFSNELEKKDYINTGLLIGAGVTLYSFDEDIRDFTKKNHSEFLDSAAPIFRKSGEFVPPLILIGAGLILDDSKSYKTGVYAAEASLATVGIIYISKNIFSRARPYMDEGSDSWFNKSFNDDYSSFPSGHSAVAFATATIIAEAYKDKKGVPELAYTLATLTALSRVYNDKHWASDVFTGSLIGYLTGKGFIKLKENSSVFTSPYGDNKSFGITFGGTF